MGIVRWILLVDYDYGRHIQYVGKGNVIHFWKVRRLHTVGSPSTIMLLRSSIFLGILGCAGLIFLKRSPYQDVSPLPVSAHFRSYSTVPHSTVRLGILRHGLLDCLHCPGFYGMPPGDEELGQDSSWRLRRPHCLLPMERNLQSVDRLFDLVSPDAYGMAIKNHRQAENCSERYVCFGSLVGSPRALFDGYC